MQPNPSALPHPETSAPERRRPAPAEGSGAARIDGLEIVPLDSAESRAVAQGHGAIFESWQRYWNGLEPRERDPLTYPAWIAGHIQGHLRARSHIPGYLFLFEGGGEVRSVLPLTEDRRHGNAFEHLHGSDCRSWALSQADHRNALRALFSSRPGGSRIDSIFLDGVQQDQHLLDPAWHSLASGAWFRSLIPLENGYEAMMSRLSSKVRSGIRRMHRRIARKHEVDLITITDLDGIQDGLRRYLEVDARSWKREDGALLSEEEHQRECLSAAFLHMGRQGRTVIQILRADGEDIAVQLCCVVDRQLQVVKTSYDADWANFGAGKLLLSESMRTWCDANDIDGLNLVTGLDWHLQWQPRQLVTHDLWLFRPGVRGLTARLKQVPPRKNVKRLLQMTGTENLARRVLRKAP